MARYISNRLKKRFNVGGDLNPLLNYIKSDKDLRLEVRMGGKAFVYYRKGKALEIGAKTMKEADPKYDKIPKTAWALSNPMKVDPKYDNIPKIALAINNPEDYFAGIKACVDAWLKSNKDRDEFDTQQGVATSNQDKDDKYIILDMEYRFPLDKIPVGNRPKKSCFDLLGIERKTGKVTFFEVKTGVQSLEGNSGIASHIKDFEEYLYGGQSAIFCKNLESDIRHIVTDKNELGILNNFDLPGNFTVGNPSLVFVFEPCGPNDKNYYRQTFAKEVGTIKTNIQYSTIYVSKKEDYKLK